MPETVYLLCAVMTVTCAVLLLRAYRRQRTHLLLSWSPPESIYHSGGAPQP
jgi:hypothetical protein